MGHNIFSPGKEE